LKPRFRLLPQISFHASDQCIADTGMVVLGIRISKALFLKEGRYDWSR
jgi:hypothetical protein